MVSELWSPFALISIDFADHSLGPYFDGTNFASWKHKMKMHILGHNPAVWAIVCVGLQGEFFDGREPNREASANELKMLQYNAMLKVVIFSSTDCAPKNSTKSAILRMQRKFGIL